MNRTRAMSGILFRPAIAAAVLSAAILLDANGPAAARADRTAAFAAAERPASSTGNAAPTAKRSPWSAPVGHFQPSPRELPALSGEDTSRTQEQIDFDRNLRICKGC